MPFLPPNQQRQKTAVNKTVIKVVMPVHSMKFNTAGLASAMASILYNITEIPLIHCLKKTRHQTLAHNFTKN